jgi:transcriptional regulator with XRE-family HTH domain
MADPRKWGFGPDARMRMGRNVTVRRLRLKMSRQDLASRTGVSTARITGLEYGRTVPGIDLLLRIADSLEEGTTVDDLLDGVRWIELPGESGDPEDGVYVVQRRVS